MHLVVVFSPAEVVWFAWVVLGLGGKKSRSGAVSFQSLTPALTHSLTHAHSKDNNVHSKSSGAHQHEKACGKKSRGSN